MSTHPEVLWAQRSSSSKPEKNIIYLTVNLPDIDESSLEYALTSTSLSFGATAGSAGVGRTKYAFDLNFFADVDPEQSTRRLTSRSFAAVLRKKESQSEYWPRLTKEKLKTPFIKTDFSKWVDEDEQDGNPGFEDDLGGDFGGMGNDFDMSKFGDLGGGATPEPNPTGIESDSESESDDEGPPALEDAEPAK